MPNQPQWISTPLTYENLHGKTVAYRIFNELNEFKEGKGKFDVTERPGFDELKRIEIIDVSAIGNQGTSVTYFIPQMSVTKIIKNPPGSDCDFSFFLC